MTVKPGNTSNHGGTRSASLGYPGLIGLAMVAVVAAVLANDLIDRVKRQTANREV